MKRSVFQLPHCSNIANSEPIYCDSGDPAKPVIHLKISFGLFIIACLSNFPQKLVAKSSYLKKKENSNKSEIFAKSLNSRNWDRERKALF